MAERTYQAKLIRKLRRRYPDALLLKNDSGYQQGIPDWTLLFPDFWAVLEIKDSLDAREQPNQGWFIKKLNDMSFAAFICPENEKEVLPALEQARLSRRDACVPVT